MTTQQTTATTEETTMRTKKISFENGMPFITISWPATQEGPAGRKRVAVIVEGEFCRVQP